MKLGWRTADVCWRLADEACGGGGSGIVTATQTLSTINDQISVPDADIVMKRLINGGGIGFTLASTPTLSPGTRNGQIVILIGDTAIANNITISPDNITPGTDLRLTGAANKTISQFDGIMLEWVETVAEWYQIAAISAN